MNRSQNSYYPFIWFDRGGWWFKAYDECFGPYEHAADARYSLSVLQQLSRQLRDELRSHHS